MSVDRDRLEQEAMTLLRKGQTERGLERYLALLKHDPRDRRIRQRVAELYYKLGRLIEAERHFREIARQLTSSGQEKQAIGVYKQLVKIKPDDAELLAELGDCYMASGFPKDAQACFEKVVEMLARVYPGEAIPHIKKLIRLNPGVLPMRIRMAELLENANWTEAAFKEWSALADEARRLGRLDDQERFLQQALRLRKDSFEVICASAELQLVQGNARGALQHLQRAYSANPGSPVVLELLARTFQAIEQPAKARQVWLEAARVHEDKGDAVAQAAALRHALECGGDDSELAERLGQAEVLARRIQLRLDAEDWTQPRTPEEIRPVVRAKVLARYGFPERARKTLEGTATLLREGVAVRALLAEVLATLGDNATALRELQGLVAPTALASRQVADRVAVLQGRPDYEATPVEEVEELDKLVDGELEPIDEMVDLGADPLVDDAPDLGADLSAFDELEDLDDEPTDPGGGALLEPQGPEAEGDALAAAGDLAGAITAYRRALALDPSNEVVLMKLGELMAAPRGSAPEPAAAPREPEPPLPDSALAFDEGPAFEDPFGGFDPAPDFGELFADEAPSAGGEDSELADAWAWLAVGRSDRARRLAEAATGLEAAVLLARAARAEGDLAGAAAGLRAAVADAAETDAAYPLAIFELAGLHAATGKTRAASRLLDELEDLDPAFDTVGVANLRRGIALLQQPG